MKRAEIICTGTELLIGSSVDTNSVYLSNRLVELGIGVQYKTIVGDTESDIEKVLENAITRVDIVIFSGGLGPTVDDLTRDVISKITGKRLIFMPEIYDRIQARIRMVHSGRVMPETVKLQAYIPEGAEYFPNQNGTAPGIAVDFKNKIILALPGPPRELKPMWNEQVHEWLKKKYPGTQNVQCKVLRTSGLPESIVDEKIHDLFVNSKNPKIGVCAYPGSVDIRLIGWGESIEETREKMSNIETQIRVILGEAIFGSGEESLESVVGGLLKEKGWKISIAESCTGGLIANRITNISGSSEYFDRGVVTYSNRAKMELLQVPEPIIQEFGAVSQETALEMAKGIQRISGSEIGLSVTGIAGPTGGTAEKPVGLVYIGLAKPDGTVDCRKYKFAGERDLIKYRASQEALDLVRRYLLESKM